MARDGAEPREPQLQTPNSKLQTLLPELLPLTALLACALLVHGSGLLGGPVFWERDTALFYYPLTDWFAEQLKAGRLPLWLPTTFAGYPLLADGEIGPLYPLNWLVLPFLPTGPAFVLLRALHTAIAAGLTYALLRTLGAGRLGSFVAGLVFGFGSFLVGQLQHDNMLRSAVWLPGQLLLLERALRSAGWARQRWLVATGLLFGLACLGVHIQAVAMSLMALGLYLVYRLALGPFRGSLAERLALLVWAPGLIAALGLLLAAAQWLPLFELGRTSYRGPGLRYDLATTYSLAPINLPALLFPYFFRAADGLWWSLWAPWETLPYVGIAPLALTAIGLRLGRRRPVVYFAGLAIFGLWIALSHYAPLNLHELLWRLPGFSSLRAPGRFSFLFVFGLAGLAAFGLDALLRMCAGVGARIAGPAPSPAGPDRARHAVPLPASPTLPISPSPHLIIGALFLLLPLALVPTFLLARQRLTSDPGYGQQLADLRYLNHRLENPDLAPYQVYDGLVFSLNPLNPKTALSLALLAAVGLALLALWRRPRRARAVAAVLVGLTALDLVVFALDYHPRATLAELTALPPVAEFLAGRTGGEHVFAEPVLKQLEPNRFVLARVSELSGYSSLQSQRHWEYISSVDRQDNALFDLWNGRFYVSPARRGDVTIPPGTGTAFRPYELLVSGGAANPTGRERFRVEPFLTAEVRILAALANAISIPQGDVVAEVTLVGADGRRVAIPLRAGLELSEHAIDRPDVAPITAHRRAYAVHGLRDSTPSGLEFTSNVYYSGFSIEPPFVVQEVEVRYVHPEGYLRLWGLGLVEPATGRVRSLFADDRAKYEHPPLYRDDEAVVFRNAAAFPRAFVVPEALARRTRAEETAIARMALRPFDPQRQVLLEEGPFDDVPLAAAPLPDDGLDTPPPAATLIERSPENLILRASGPGVLVVTDAYHRGWRAYLDGGREVPVYLANYVARGVGLPPGEHTVELVFDPLSWRLGRAISLSTLLFALLVLAPLPRLRRP